MTGEDRPLPDSAPSPDRADRGFTLLEVLVALAILGVSLGVLLGTFSAGLERTRQAEDRQRASALLQSLLAGAGTESPLVEGETGGTTPDGWRWRLRVVPYGSAEDLEAWPVAAREVTAEVVWPGIAGERSLAFTTLRLAPKER